MTRVAELWRQFQVLAGTVVFYATAAAVGFSAAAERLGELAPDGSLEAAAAWLVRAAAWLTAAAVVARRVTTVPKDLRGLLPVAEQPNPPTVRAWPADGGGTWSYLAEQPTGASNSVTVTREQPAEPTGE